MNNITKFLEKYKNLLPNEYLVTEERLAKILKVLLKRQYDLRVFMDYVYSHHNLSAIVRTCDAVGVMYLYYRHQKQLRLNDEVTMWAHKWLLVEYIENIVDFYKKMKKEGYQIVVTTLDKDSIDFRKVDYTKPTLVVVWNEVDWVSQESIDFADYKVIIPMYWMSQSLNVSVATAVILYEAQRQRQLVWMYNNPTLPESLLKNILKKWVYDDIIKSKML